MIMEQLATVQFVKNRYGCSTPTARKYLRQCVPHMENPCCATMTAFREWEDRRTVIPAEGRRREILYKAKTGRVIVPRKREG
jgi:hypothetical protein